LSELIYYAFSGVWGSLVVKIGRQNTNNLPKFWEAFAKIGSEPLMQVAIVDNA
jgi:hypothetical protein